MAMWILLSQMLKPAHEARWPVEKTPLTSVRSAAKPAHYRPLYNRRFGRNRV